MISSFSRLNFRPVAALFTGSWGGAKLRNLGSGGIEGQFHKLAMPHPGLNITVGNRPVTVARGGEVLVFNGTDPP